MAPSLGDSLLAGGLDNAPLSGCRRRKRLVCVLGKECKKGR